jgi:hypothetical protein
MPPLRFIHIFFFCGAETNLYCFVAVVLGLFDLRDRHRLGNNNCCGRNNSLLVEALGHATLDAKHALGCHKKYAAQRRGLQLLPLVSLFEAELNGSESIEADQKLKSRLFE